MAIIEISLICDLIAVTLCIKEFYTKKNKQTFTLTFETRKCSDVSSNAVNWIFFQLSPQLLQNGLQRYLLSIIKNSKNNIYFPFNKFDLRKQHPRSLESH